MDVGILREIGLSESEIKVYLALLELGSSKKAMIVRKSGIASSKVYEVVDKLIEKGLASVVVKDKVHHFSAAPPARIKDFLLEKESRIKEQSKSLSELLPMLEARHKAVQIGTDAEVYRGWKGIQTVYGDLLESLSPNEEYFIFGASKGEDPAAVKRFFTRFNEKATRKNLRANIIFNETARGNIPNARKTGKVRYLKQTTPSEILVYKDKTAVVLLESEPLAILMHGGNIAKSFKAYFKAMWAIAND